MGWSIRRLNRAQAINGAKTYLEIGVETGVTFKGVTVERKDGVDPYFAFDPATLANDRVRLHALRSDAFWASDLPLAYDLIMLDGLHTFEQTFRDFLASLSHAHARTIWLIDDTVPSDVFSALPDHSQSMRHRQRMGIPGYAWHGDVFKLVLALHDFFPTLSYATIINSGNPQTLVWKEPRAGFEPVMNSLEQISRLSFFDIDAHVARFNLVDEETAFARLMAGFAKA
jgi:hypothetical protein